MPPPNNGSPAGTSYDAGIFGSGLDPYGEVSLDQDVTLDRLTLGTNALLRHSLGHTAEVRTLRLFGDPAAPSRFELDSSSTLHTTTTQLGYPVGDVYGSFRHLGGTHTTDTLQIDGGDYQLRPGATLRVRDRLANEGGGLLFDGGTLELGEVGHAAQVEGSGWTEWRSGTLHLAQWDSGTVETFMEDVEPRTLFAGRALRVDGFVNDPDLIVDGGQLVADELAIDNRLELRRGTLRTTAGDLRVASSAPRIGAGSQVEVAGDLRDEALQLDGGRVELSGGAETPIDFRRGELALLDPVDTFIDNDGELDHGLWEWRDGRGLTEGRSVELAGHATVVVIGVQKGHTSAGRSASKRGTP